MFISSSWPASSFHLVQLLYLCIFSISLCLLFFFFKHQLLYFPYLLLLQCPFFSYFSSCHPISCCLNYELYIQSLSGTFSDCLLLVLSISVFIQETTGFAEQWLKTSRPFLSFILATRRMCSMLKLRTSEFKKEKRKKKKIEKERKKKELEL